MDKKNFIKNFILFLILIAWSNLNCMENDNPEEIRLESLPRVTQNIEIDLERVEKVFSQLNKNFSQYNKKKNPSFFERRIMDGDATLSHIIQQTGLTIFTKLLLDPILTFLFRSKEEKLISKLNKDIDNNNLYQQQSKLIYSLMQSKEAQKKYARNPTKRAKLEQASQRLNQARKETDRQQQIWEDKFTQDILKQKKRKSAQPKTVFYVKDGELVKPEDKSDDVEQIEKITQETSEDLNQFLELMDKEEASNLKIAPHEADQPEGGYIVQQLKANFPKIAAFYFLG